jgi:hypothetical protein
MMKVLMVGNLEPEENVLQWFEQTSNEPYNRHDYKLVYSNGETKVFEEHQDFMAAWFQYPKQLALTCFPKRLPNASQSRQHHRVGSSSRAYQWRQIQASGTDSEVLACPREPPE